MISKTLVWIIASSYFLLLQNCATQEDSDDESTGTGTLIHEGFSDKINCFWFLIQSASSTWENVVNPAVLTGEVERYYPLKLWNSSYAYNVSLKVPVKDYTKEQYSISLRILTEDWRECSESKIAVFYRIAEENGIAEYRTYKEGATYKDGQGIFIFLAQKEMPSVEWYHVLKTCGSKFRLEGVVNE